MSLLFPPRLLRIAVFILAIGVIAWLSLSPARDLPQGLSFWDKAEHACAYLGLALVGAWAFPTRLGRLAAGLFLAGVGVEFLQASMGFGRQGDPMDAVANSVGIVAGLSLALAARRLLGLIPQRPGVR
jgi:VanZ family protein